MIENSRFENLDNEKTRIYRRVVRKRFCIRVEFSQTGKIGKMVVMIYIAMKF